MDSHETRFPAAITTAPRRVNYLDKTLQSVFAAGWNSPLIFSDVGRRNDTLESHHPQLRVFSSPVKLGPRWNMARAARWLADLHPVADGVVVFQDDVKLAGSLLPWIGRNLWPEPLHRIGVVSLYTAGPNETEGSTGWHKISDLPKRAYGALAYVFPVDFVRMCFSESVLDGPPSDEKRTMPADHWIGKLCAENNLSYWCHSPSFVQHIGAISSMSKPAGVAEYRTAKTFLQSCGDLPCS